MERKGILMRLREGGGEMYEKYHAEVWPEMLAILKKAGIENYSIWREGDLLFAYYEVEDMQKASEFRVCKATGNRRSASMMGPGYFALMAINIQNGMILSGGGVIIA